MLIPTGFSKEEAEAVVGKQIVRVFTKSNGEKVDGHVGRIIASEHAPELHGNDHQYFVVVQWIDREGRQSRPIRFSKDCLANATRPLLIQEIAAAQYQQRTSIEELKQQASVKKLGRKRGLGM